MRAGAMRQRISLQKKTASRGAMGGEVISWVTQTTTWADARPLSGAESVSAEQYQSSTTVEFRIRYDSAAVPKPEWRVLWGPNTYEIIAVINVDGRNRELRLQCREGLASG